METTIQKFVRIHPLWQRLAAVLLVGCCTGCYTPGPILSTTQPNVIVFRGAGGYFPQLAEFEDALIDEGACPTVAYAEFHRRVAERVIAARNTGRLQGPLVIVGYSAGADKALSVSRDLAQNGIEVDKLVLIEPSDGGRVPGNVRECVNIYRPQPWSEMIPFFSGARVLAENETTHLVNYDVRAFNDGRYDGEGHFTLTTNPYIQDMMINEVMVAFEREDDEMEMPYLSENSRPANVAVSREVPPPAED